VELAIKTGSRAVGIYITHLFYSIFEKAFIKAGLLNEAKKLEQKELDRMFVPDIPLVPRTGYG
ncbi:MAG: hypothetical protein QXN71_01890, partial [Candidatus Aenigmatarchaeota archaeon]